jgi:hypothetical protein
MIGSIDPLGGIRAVANKTNGTATVMYSKAFNVQGGVSMSLLLTVHAAFGTTPTLDVSIEHSADMVTWAAHTPFTQATDDTSQLLTIAAFLPYVRLKVDVDGTSSVFVFECSGNVSADS